MNRQPEFHLYLYTLEGYKRDVINAYTVAAVNDLISLGKDVDTYQVICCTTDLFNKGYRIFVHETPASQFEITLGTCEGTTMEIKMGHDLPKLILAGEFESPIDPDKEYHDFIKNTVKDKDAIRHYANCTIDLVTGVSRTETREDADEDPDYDSNTIPFNDFYVRDFYEDGFPLTAIPPEKLLDQKEIKEIREIAESIKNIVSEYKNQYSDNDPDTAIWRLYEKAYPNNNGLPDISYMNDREDVVHYD